MSKIDEILDHHGDWHRVTDREQHRDKTKAKLLVELDKCMPEKYNIDDSRDNEIERAYMAGWNHGESMFMTMIRQLFEEDTNDRP